jgi:hypothetical protein
LDLVLINLSERPAKAPVSEGQEKRTSNVTRAEDQRNMIVLFVLLPFQMWNDPVGSGFMRLDGREVPQLSRQSAKATLPLRRTETDAQDA